MVENVTACLAAGTDLTAGTYFDGHTPLHEGAGNENPAVLKGLQARQGRWRSEERDWWNAAA